MTSGDDEGTQHHQRRHQYGPVLQGREFHDVHIRDTVVRRLRRRWRWPSCPRRWRVHRPGRRAGRGHRAAEPGAGTGAVVVSAVAGLAGVGKTALAIQAAHAARRAGWFPGGVLFLDLHGYDDQAVQPGQALDALLRALGVPAEHIPPGMEERAGLYRSALAAVTDPVLVVADNASAEAQVRPLLPGPGPHRVLVTSRHTLAGLGARLLDVEVLDEQAAIALVEEVLRAARPGDDRISSDPTAAGGWRGCAAGCRWRCGSRLRCWPPTRP